MRFKKGQVTKESFKVIMHDLECLELKDTKDNKYHYKLLKNNLKDIFGIKGIGVERMDMEDFEFMLPCKTIDELRYLRNLIDEEIKEVGE